MYAQIFIYMLAKPPAATASVIDIFYMCITVLTYSQSCSGSYGSVIVVSSYVFDMYGYIIIAIS